MVDFAVPFSPRTRTPPMAGDTALSSSASFRSAIPTMPANGYALCLSPAVVAIEPVLPGVPRPKSGTQGSRSLWLPGQDGVLAGHPRSQLRDSPGFAPAFLRVATSAQHGTRAGRRAAWY